MKTFISILILLMGAAGIVLTREGKDVHRSCTCSGTFCSCDATCLDQNEIPSCACGTFSCVCKCNPKDAANSNDIQSPTMSGDQEANSNKAELYFRNLGVSPGADIANEIKSLREAIKSGDTKSYQSNAELIEANYSKLPEAQKRAWENWSTQNLKK